MNIFREIGKDLKKIGLQICSDETIWSQSTIEAPKRSVKWGYFD